MLTTKLHDDFAWVCIEYGLGFVEAGDDCWETRVCSGDDAWPIYCILGGDQVEFRAPLPVTVPPEQGPALSRVLKRDKSAGGFAQIDGNGAVWFRTVAKVGQGETCRRQIAAAFFAHVTGALEQLAALHTVALRAAQPA